jgi:hypothetical protein
MQTGEWPISASTQKGPVHTETEHYQ